jgi:peptide/nickel transport system substrate-binding protein
MFYALGWQADFPVPDNFYSPRFSCPDFVPNSTGNLNVSGFCDPDIDNLAKRAYALDTTDPAAANVLWQQVDQKVTDASPAIFTTTWKADALISPRLRNYTRTPLGYLIFDQMWVQ